MALAQVYTAIAGDVITAARWNNEFGNIYTNGTDVAFPLTKAVSYAGFTVTYDVAGVSTITSPASTGFVLTVGSKSGTPGASGGLLYIPAATFTDTATITGGTASLWSGVSIRTPTLAANVATVTTTEAATLYVEGAPIAGVNETLTNSYAALFGAGIKVNGKITSTDNHNITVEDARTNTVSYPLVITSTTSSTPANGIGTGITIQAESADETPSDVGQLQFALSDKTAGSEDSYFQIMLRVAGAALSNAYKWIATTAFQGIFTHANSADRTYSLPDYSTFMDAGFLTKGPTSCGASSTMAHEGSVTISANQALDGVHFYTDFTLDVGKTAALDNSSHRLVIVATRTITINGTIDGVSAGAAGGSGGIAAGTGSVGHTQPGGGGGDGSAGAAGAGGQAQQHGVTVASGGTAGASSAGGGGSQRSGDASLFDYLATMGGAGGGGGAQSLGGAGGRGGGSIVLIAPTVVLGSASALKTSGGAGTAGGNNSGGGGGGGAGNILIICNSYTDNGCTFTLSGGAGGSAGASGGFAGGNGAAGVRQINIYA